MGLVRPVAAIVVTGLGVVAAGSCGLPDVFRPAGPKDVVVRYVGDTVLNTGQRIAPAVSVTADGAPVPNPHLTFSSSDTTVLAIIPIGDTLVMCRSGHVQLTVRLISSMTPDSTLSAQDSIHVTGQPTATCP